MFDHLHPPQLTDVPTPPTSPPIQIFFKSKQNKTTKICQVQFELPVSSQICDLALLCGWHTRGCRLKEKQLRPPQKSLVFLLPRTVMFWIQSFPSFLLPFLPPSFPPYPPSLPSFFLFISFFLLPLPLLHFTLEPQLVSLTEKGNTSSKATSFYILS